MHGHNRGRHLFAGSLRHNDKKIVYSSTLPALTIGKAFIRQRFQR
jgi:hypothetical protein